MELLDLPQEILDHIYTYLGWDESLEIEPQLSQLRKLSLISKRMRETVIPQLFRTVTLALGWQDSILIEPGLFRLRKHCPKLAQHIRGVHICTRRVITRAQHHRHEPFVVPEDVHDWLDPASTSWRSDDDWNLRIYDEHRRCADSVALGLYNELSTALQLPEPADARAEVLISHMVGESGRERELQLTSTRGFLNDRQFRRGRGDVGEQGDNHSVERSSEEAKVRIDALAVVMLCLPSNLTHLIIDNGLVSSRSYYQHEFVLCMTAMAMKLFAHRIESLTIAISARPMPRDGSLVQLETKIISSEAISSLRLMKSLTLAAHVKPLSETGMIPHAYVLHNVHRWLSATALNDLTICNVIIHAASHLSSDSLLSLIAGLPCLQRLRLKDMYYSGSRSTNNESSPIILWLEFLIAVRRSNPDVHMELRNLAYGPKHGTFLPIDALKWCKKALPAGATVAFDRELRLVEDFESFLPMWEAEASERGVAAAEERKSGALVDMAMGTRGIQHNVRQDLGEWMEI